METAQRSVANPRASFSDPTLVTWHYVVELKHTPMWSDSAVSLRSVESNASSQLYVPVVVLPFAAVPARCESC